METIQVIVDPDLEPIMPRYMEIQHDELKNMLAAIAAGDSETTRILGHKLKGTGTSYGFAPLTELGAGIEEAGKSGDLATAAQLAGHVRTYLDNVEIIYGEQDQS